MKSSLTPLGAIYEQVFATIPSGLETDSRKGRGRGAGVCRLFKPRAFYARCGLFWEDRKVTPAVGDNVALQE